MKHRRALVLAVTYAFLAGLWILLSDAALFLLLSGQGLSGRGRNGPRAWSSSS
jgi:hypothetical protein